MRRKIGLSVVAAAQLIQLFLLVAIQRDWHRVGVSSLRLYFRHHSVKNGCKHSPSGGNSCGVLFATKQGDGSSSMGPQRDMESIGCLTNWIEENGGEFHAFIDEHKRNHKNYGLCLNAIDNTDIGEVLISVPKSLCICSDPSKMVHPLSESTQLLMNSLQPHHWRMRLAIALLSERVECVNMEIKMMNERSQRLREGLKLGYKVAEPPSSLDHTNRFFGPYLRDLPIEFWGNPLFFTSSEVQLLQDYAVMKQTRDRCSFLGEFVTSVLVPLSRTGSDPFGGVADVDKIGWAFILAASRAIRYIVKEGDDGSKTTVALETPVMVPGIDLMTHSFDPNCEVTESDDGDAYIVKTIRSIAVGEQLTISYGPLSNDELLCDYGFTVDGNPYDHVGITVDELLLNTARSVMSQSNFSISSAGAMAGGGSFSAQRPQINALRGSSSISKQGGIIPVGRSNDVFDLDWLHQWQHQWIRCITGRDSHHMHKLDISLGYTGTAQLPSSSSSRTSPSSVLRSIDPRLLAVLRVLYSDSEEQLLAHGYDPFLLKDPGSLLATRREAHVVRSLIGIATVILNGYGTDIERDLYLLSRKVDGDDDNAGGGSEDAGFISQSTADTVMVKNDCLRHLRSIFSLPHLNALSPTMRRLAAANAVSIPNMQASTSGDGSSGDSGGRSAEAVMQKSTRSKYSGLDLTTQGVHLSHNTREAFRYSIRKKQLLIGIIEQLADYHRMLQQSSPEEVPDLMSVLSTASPLDGRRAGSDKPSRTAQIRELLEEVKQQKGPRSILQTAGSVSSKWTIEGADL